MEFYLQSLIRLYVVVLNYTQGHTLYITYLDVPFPFDQATGSGQRTLISVTVTVTTEMVNSDANLSLLKQTEPRTQNTGAIGCMYNDLPSQDTSSEDGPYRCYLAMTHINTLIDRRATGACNKDTRSPPACVTGGVKALFTSVVHRHSKYEYFGTDTNEIPIKLY